MKYSRAFAIVPDDHLEIGYERVLDADGVVAAEDGDVTDQGLQKTYELQAYSVVRFALVLQIRCCVSRRYRRGREGVRKVVLQLGFARRSQPCPDTHPISSEQDQTA
jgi:hypothetical protein